MDEAAAAAAVLPAATREGGGDRSGSGSDGASTSASEPAKAATVAVLVPESDTNSGSRSGRAGRTDASAIEQLYKQHQQRVTELKSNSVATWQLAHQQSVAAGVALAEAANDGVVELFQREVKIEEELAQLVQRTDRVHKQMHQWAQTVVKLNNGLKHLGDLGNWASYIERDVNDTVDVLENLSTMKRRALGVDSVASHPAVSPPATRS